MYFLKFIGRRTIVFINGTRINVNNDNNNNNIIPEALKYRVGVCLTGRKNLSALVGSLSRDGVSIKTLVGGNHKTQPQIECNVKSKN